MFRTARVSTRIAGALFAANAAAFLANTQNQANCHVSTSDKIDETLAGVRRIEAALQGQSVAKKTTGKVDAIIGSQWGDEGKGKLTDILSGKYDICARVAGGSNAGHTIVVEVRHLFLQC